MIWLKYHYVMFGFIWKYQKVGELSHVCCFKFKKMAEIMDHYSTGQGYGI